MGGGGAYQFRSAPPPLKIDTICMIGMKCYTNFVTGRPSQERFALNTALIEMEKKD